MNSDRRILVLGIHLFFVAAFVISALHAPLGDWGNYYFGSKAFSQGNGIRIYDPVFFNRFVADSDQRHFFLSYTQIPPLSLLFYLPFSFFKVHFARLLWTVLGTLFFAFSLTRLFQHLKIDVRWSLLLPLIFFLPLRSDFDLGQSYLFLIALLAEGWMAREKGHLVLAAFCFALAIHLKIFPAILLIWLMAEKDWKMLGRTILLVILLFAVSLPLIDWHIWKLYVLEILPRLAKGEINNTFAISYQSVNVLLKNIFVRDGLHNPGAAFNHPLAYEIGKMIWAGIVLAVAFLFSSDKKQDSFLRFSIWILAGMLISGYGSSYGLLQLVFLAMAIFSCSTISNTKKILLLVIMTCIANIPIQFFLTLSIPLSFPRLFFLLLLFAFLIFVFRPQWNRFAFLFFLFPLLSFFTYQRDDDGSAYFLSREPSLLITDLETDHENVIYSYLDVDGLHRVALPFSESIAVVSMLDYDAHCIHCNGEDYYFPYEQISKPILINGKDLLYLSDKNRGVGFYTIRILKIK